MANILYVQLLDSSKASKTLAFAILGRGLSFESGKLTRIIHIAWYRSADPANTVQEAVATSRDAKFLWQTLKAPDDDRVTVTCVANPMQIQGLTFEFLWHCMFHLEVVERCSLLNIFSSITRAYTRGGCFLHDCDMATWRWTSFKSRRI